MESEPNHLKPAFYLFRATLFDIGILILVALTIGMYIGYLLTSCDCYTIDCILRQQLENMSNAQSDFIPHEINFSEALPE
jgi:hypothetical protein